MTHAERLSPPAPTPLLTFDRVTKRFFGIRALEDVSFSVAAGEIHAVVGENGAGKSTLMKVLVGVHAPDAGRLVWAGAPVAISGPDHARRLGIEIVYQEIELPPNLTVMECLFLGREPANRGWIDPRRMHRQAAAVLERLELPLAPACLLERLSIAERQLVQIARALAGEPRLLILDEPTSALTEHEAARLFSLLDGLRRRGTTLLYVSHRLEEIFRLADTVTVLRDGRHVATTPRLALTREALVRRMLGEAWDETAQRDDEATGREAQVPPARPVDPASRYPGPEGADVALEVRGLAGGRKYREIHFTVGRGEVVGMFGIIGAGRTEIARALFGLDPPDAGEIRLDGRRIAPASPAEAVAAGLALVPEDRQRQGLVLSMSVGRNLSLAALPHLARTGRIDPVAEGRLIAGSLRRLAIRPSDPEVEARSLSGGNQQKVVLARWLATRPRLLILDEPTRGIDIGAKREVHALVRQLTAEGLAVLLISSELDEALALADRLLVLRAGRITAELDTRRTTAPEVMAHAV